MWCDRMCTYLVISGDMSLADGVGAEATKKACAIILYGLSGQIACPKQTTPTALMPVPKPAG